MDTIIKILVGIIAFQHLYFMWFEMFAWESRGKKLFKAPSKSFFKDTKSMAANQGLYNGFLAAGLIWSLLLADPIWSRHIAIFFTACVAVAGIYGAISVNKIILYLQGIPALVTLGLLIFG